jgi:hypothetical protein
LAINGHDFSTLMHDKATTWLISGLLALGLKFISASLYLLIAALALAGGGLAGWRAGGLVWPRSSRAVRRRGAELGCAMARQGIAARRKCPHR